MPSTYIFLPQIQQHPQQQPHKQQSQQQQIDAFEQQQQQQQQLHGFFEDDENIALWDQAVEEFSGVDISVIHSCLRSLSTNSNKEEQARDAGGGGEENLHHGGEAEDLESSRIYNERINEETLYISLAIEELCKNSSPLFKIFGTCFHYCMIH